MIEFYPPVSTSEWIQSIGAAITMLIGLFYLLLPKFTLRASGLARESVGSDAVIVARGHLSGLLLGFGLATLLLQQPLLYLALGAGWGFSAVSQIISIIVDGNRTAASFIALMLKAVITAFLLLAVLGFFG